MNTLRDLIQNAARLTDALIESNGEISLELEQALAINELLPAKIDNYRATIDQLDMQEEFFRKRAAENAKIAKGFATVTERLKTNLKLALKTLEVTELEGNEYKYKISKMAPKLVIDESLLSAAYLMAETKMIPDKEKIKQDLELGLEVSGAKFEEVNALRSYPTKKVTK